MATGGSPGTRPGVWRDFPASVYRDCRRTVAWNLRATVPERVAMSFTGHKTRGAFERYNVVSERDLSNAARRLADYLAGQKSEPTVIP